MINVYALLKVLEQGMTLFQLNQWKSEGIWHPISYYKKSSNEIEIVTNLFLPDQSEYHIQLAANYTEQELDQWKELLEQNQWKIYPLLANILKIFLPNQKYQLFYTNYPKGFLSVIAKPVEAEPL